MKKILSLLGPGLLVAATGVGAGDLATAAFTGSNLGVTVLWAVVVGALFKYILNEGLARWQLTTGTTLLQALPRVVLLPFLIYFFFWSFLVASALMSASGVAAHAIFPVFSSAVTGKILFGIIHSLGGLLIVRLGGYAVFEKFMKICIAIMFLTVLYTAVKLSPDLPQIFSGLVMPSIQNFDSKGLTWTIALIGGVGGTVTILCYGYWIREEGRFDISQMRTCRIDLGSGYIMTALFGLSMVIIGSTIQIEGSGAGLLVSLSRKLEDSIGAVASWTFLIGAWAAIFSSLLGVWQSVPYLYADIVNILKGDGAEKTSLTTSAPYRIYLYVLSFLPLSGLWIGFARMQKFYAVTGALFIPFLAAVLLVLGLRGTGFTNRPVTMIFLILILLFFCTAGALRLLQIF